MCREYGQSDSPFVEFKLSPLSFHCTCADDQPENLCTPDFRFVVLFKFTHAFSQENGWKAIHDTRSVNLNSTMGKFHWLFTAHALHCHVQPTWKPLYFSDQTLKCHGFDIAVTTFHRYLRAWQLIMTLSLQALMLSYGHHNGVSCKSSRTSFTLLCITRLLLEKAIL